MSNDPHWTQARHTGDCASCFKSIGIGDRIFTDALGRHTTCAACGERSAALNLGVTAFQKRFIRERAERIMNDLLRSIDRGLVPPEWGVPELIYLMTIKFEKDDWAPTPIKRRVLRQWRATDL